MIIGTVLPSYRQTGPIIASSLIAKGVSELDNNCSFVFISLRKNEEKASAWLKETLGESGRYYELEMERFPNRNTINELKDIVEIEKIDILHSHCYWPTVIGSKINAVPKVVTIHEQTKISIKNDYGEIISRFFMPAFINAIRKYAKIVAVSDSAHSHVLSLIKNRHVPDFSVILNGVEDHYSGNIRKTDDKTHFASFCNLTKNKNISFAIKGFNALLKRGISNFTYGIYGNGPEYKKLRNYIQSERLQNHVFLKGTVPRNKVFPIFEEYDAIIALSFSEGLSLVAIESQMMGKPLLCSHINSFEEILNNGYNGYFFDNNDLEDFVDKIVNILNNPDRIKELSYNSRKRYLSRFTIKMMAEKYLDSYRYLYSSE
jgi:glycosyltransferase involved in cell wall biosynthesis